MPRHELEIFFKATHNTCGYAVRLPSPRLIQELVQALEGAEKVAAPSTDLNRRQPTGYCLSYTARTLVGLPSGPVPSITSRESLETGAPSITASPRNLTARIIRSPEKARQATRIRWR